MISFKLHPFEGHCPDDLQVWGTFKSLNDNDDAHLYFKVDGLELPSFQKQMRKDELWKETCLEFFISASGHNSYIEYNFSPQGSWNCYSFQKYREGMKNLDLKEPIIKSADNEMEIVLPFHDIKQFFHSSDLLFGPSAILKKGDESFHFALDHPKDKPDFHLKDYYTLKI